MKTVLVVFNSIHFPAHVRAAAVKIAKEKNADLVALLLPYDDMENDYPFPNDMTETAAEEWEEKIKAENQRLAHHIYRLLQDDAAPLGVNFQVRQLKKTSDLLVATGSADLLVLDASLQFEDMRLQDVLSDALCPVFISGINTGEVEKLVLTYDGTASSQFVIEQLAALFPEWGRLPAFLVSVNMEETEWLLHKEFINQWLPAHFKKLEIVQLHGDVDKTLTHYLQQHPDNTLVVMGAFGRGIISRFFHPSTAKNVITETRLSLFIAHK